MVWRIDGDDMTRIEPLESTALCLKGRELVEQYEAATGLRPNVVRTLAHAPEVLRHLLGMFACLTSGTLDETLMEQVALAVAQANGCTYCLSAHTALGEKTGLCADRIDESRWAMDPDPRRAAVLRFTRALVINRGQVADEDFQPLRDAGFSDAAIVELVAFVSMHNFLNYLTEAARTPVDFPKVCPHGPCSARQSPDDAGENR